MYNINTYILNIKRYYDYLEKLAVERYNTFQYYLIMNSKQTYK